MAAPLHLVSAMEPRRLWICPGLRRTYRITDGRIDYGEWGDLSLARAMLVLLLEANPDARGVDD